MKNRLNTTITHTLQTNIHKIDYSIYVDWKHNIYNNMQGTKPKHAKGQVTFNVNNLSTSYRKEANMIIQMTWLETM